MKKMLSIALCAAMILSFAASVSASSLRRALSNKNMPIATSKEDDQPINKVKQPQIPTDWEKKYEYRQKNEVDPQFIQSLQEFGAKTSSLLLTSPTENQSYSPVSFAYALAMLGNGAKGQTAQQIADALGVDTISSSNQQFHKFYNYNYSSEQGNVLKLANSIWVQEDFPLQKDFSKKLAEQFYASAYSVDFPSSRQQMPCPNGFQNRLRVFSTQPLLLTRCRSFRSSTPCTLKELGPIPSGQQTTPPRNSPLPTAAGRCHLYEPDLRPPLLLRNRGLHSL